MGNTNINNSDLQIRPTKNHLIVKKLDYDEHVENTNFVFAKDFHHKPLKAKIIDIGDYKLDTHMDIKKDDIVLLPKYGSTKIESSNGEYHLCHIKDIIGVL